MTATGTTSDVRLDMFESMVSLTTVMDLEEEARDLSSWVNRWTCAARANVSSPPPPAFPDDPSPSSRICLANTYHKQAKTSKVHNPLYEPLKLS
jgi:hypothetical protein